MNPLIGKTLTGIKIAKDRVALLFQTTDGDVLVRAMKADAQKVLGDGVRVYSTPMVRASSR